jgi:hypothetical protein
MTRRRRLPKPRRGLQGIDRLNAMGRLCHSVEDTPEDRALWEELKDEILTHWDPETVAAWWVFEKGEKPPEQPPDPRLEMLE